MDPNRLDGKNILITGAARGMGACNAEHFAEQGANVCLGDLDEDEARKVADALAVGFLRGALAAAGAPARVDATAGRVTAQLDEAGIGGMPSPVATVDARTETYQRGVVQAMRAIVDLRPGDHLEVLTDGPGAPAAYARWADRAGHQVVDVARVRDIKGRSGVRILLRKATGR